MDPRRKLLVALVPLGLGAMAFVLVREFLSRSSGVVPESSTKVSASGTAGPPPAVDSEAPPSNQSMTRTEVGEALSIPSPVDLDQVDRDHDLHGIVLDPEDRPVAGALIEIMAYPWRRLSILDYERFYEIEPVAATRSARDGTFSFPLSRGRMVDLRVQVDPFSTEVASQCVAGERVCVRLNPAARLEVVTREQSGQPVAGVKIWYWRNTGQTPSDHREGETRPDGRHVFENLSPGKARLRFAHPSLGSPGWQTVAVVEGETVVHELTMVAGREIRGRVTDAGNGLPIAGAQIGASWVLDCAVHSDADGRYVFPCWTGIGVDDLHVVAEGFGRQGNKVPPSGDVDFALLPGDQARGTVRSATGDAVPGACVTALASQSPGSEQEIDSRSTRTDAGGAFLLTSLRRDLPHTLVILAEGHGRLLLDFDPSPDESGLIDLGEIRLPAARLIEGVALDGDGAPIPGAPVTLKGHNPDRGRLRPGASTFACPDYYAQEEERHTDDLGRFRFPDLPPGSYRLVLQPQGCGEVQTTVVLPVEEDVLDVVLEVRDTNTLTVVVINDRNQPLQGMRVNVEWGASSTAVDTNREGKASFHALPARDLRVGVLDHNNDYIRPEEIRTKAEGQELRITLEQTSLVQGVVVGPDGMPLERMKIEAHLDDSKRVAYTNEEGRFSLQVPRGRTLDLHVTGIRGNKGGRGSERTPYRGSLTAVTSPAEGLVVRVEKMVYDGSVEVLVVDADGRPIPEARVFHTQGTHTTDSQGLVRIGELPREEISLTVVAPATFGTEGLLAGDSRRVLPEGQRVVFELRPGTTLSGTVFTATGEPAAQARVLVFHESKEMGSRLTDASGRFAMLVPLAPAYRLMAELVDRDGNRRYGTIEGVAPATQNLEIRLTEQ